MDERAALASDHGCESIAERPEVARAACVLACVARAAIGGAGAPGTTAKPLPNRAAGVLSDGDSVRVEAGPEGVRFLLLAARPLREPVVQYGPFVMNTREEIEQALADYRDGRLATAA